ncbi:TPA: hypothetical protein U1B14_002048 [Streptococcus suis]|uniref:Uncharacterized protein n=1 Tax=Streptococcus suis TaxID=1307 RepID=A0A116KA64_STRSU|nr:hypothetical protein [Streptococcus suis]MCE6986874.1 hypothetical protein [Streptococcus suis]MCO8207883.1 hypothetical protein [Streptococcus suis]MCO8212444.1 hypothetical protein [Streptococcus suis]NQG42629.1 hypothetical protein [Streptococcus suis]NQG46005.1 hypothetical protein [Streptococcus suis]
MDNEVLAELKILVIDLKNATSKLHSELINNTEKQTAEVSIGINELYSQYTALKLFLSIYREYGHYEITSLISFFERYYHELKSTFIHNDRNTSWLVSEHNNFDKQAEIVIRMLD